MQKQTPPEATKAIYPILRQIVNLIPPNVFHAEASATKDLSRAFTPWSHVVALIYQQLTKTESLNGVCEAALRFTRICVSREVPGNITGTIA